MFAEEPFPEAPAPLPLYPRCGGFSLWPRRPLRTRVEAEGTIAVLGPTHALRFIPVDQTKKHSEGHSVWFRCIVRGFHGFCDARL